MSFLHGVHFLLQVADHLVRLTKFLLLLFLRFHLLIELLDYILILMVRLLYFPFKLRFLLIESLGLSLVTFP